MQVTTRSFGSYQGIQYDEICLTNRNQQTLVLADLGARITQWLVPNEDGTTDNIVLGYPDAESVFTWHDFYYGATVGRVAGRIDRASFVIDGKTYPVDKNDGENQNHGGFNGLDQQKWAYTIDEHDHEAAVTFTYTDLEGNNGYPGTVNIAVTHRFNDDNQWSIQYHANTSAATPLNLTNHVYFNLNGDNEMPVKNHIFQVFADQYLPLRKDSIPTGEIADVSGTAFDLREPVRYQEVLDQYLATDLKPTGGFDHPWLLTHDNEVDGIISLPEKHRQVSVKTDQSALVIYTHNANVPDYYHYGHPAITHSGTTFETQTAPDAVHHAEDWGNIILHPDERYTQKTTFQFHTI
ncbi:MAG: aldose epimerase family protein [Aerococcus sp.]|nr:aldose epimerase family protein [Aerococcus sp.]